MPTEIVTTALAETTMISRTREGEPEEGWHDIHRHDNTRRTGMRGFQEWLSLCFKAPVTAAMKSFE